jgi:hypothetical protein
MNTQHITSKILFKKLLNKIRSQQSLWTIKSMSEDEGEMTTVSETGSKAAGAVGSKEEHYSLSNKVAPSACLFYSSQLFRLFKNMHIPEKSRVESKGLKHNPAT